MRKATALLHGGRAVCQLRGEGRPFFYRVALSSKPPEPCRVISSSNGSASDRTFLPSAYKVPGFSTMYHTTPAMLPLLVLLLPLLHPVSGSSSDRRRSLSCFQCSWLAEQPVDPRRQNEIEERWKKAYERSEDAIDNPFKRPLLGVETFAEMPTRTQLAAHCYNCTRPDGMCARWTFYGSTGLPVNVTWMCVNSLNTGCFVEYMASHFVKEVCLCADRHHCNAAGLAAPVPLVALLLCAVWIVVLRKVFS